MLPLASRRLVLRGAGLLPLGLAAAPARAQRIGDRSRFLWVRNQIGEEVAGHYIRADGWIDWRVVQRMQHLFRDLRENTAGPMPVLLLDVLWLIQTGWRSERPLILMSGYRTPRTNASLEGAAFHSRHLEGQAADIAVRDVPIGQVAEAATSFSRIYDFMGVGTYPGFVHVDIGPRRAWERGAPRRIV
ncbi:MAG: DUF882 domain-containing protein [Acetobacteraceae bacterium]|nr:DUF882 domain-containing protein [Acetobacteraceae bacterium]